MQKIVPHLWFDRQAKEAADFYVKTFPDSKIKSDNTIHDTPSGDAEMVALSIMEQDFMFISAGPYFKVNPSVSFLVFCKTKEEVDLLWEKLSAGGNALMELGKYPFSERYGWMVDKYGVSWQIMLAGDREIKQRVIPTLMFVGDVAGKAEEAINFYVSVFKNSKVGDIMRYGKEAKPDKEGTIAHASFVLEGREFAAMDSNRAHEFKFCEAISLVVNCENQEEVNYFWEKLSAVPEAEQCGWLKDKYGFSWQIVPTVMGEMLGSSDKEKLQRVTAAFLKMKKFDIATLKKAYDGDGGK